MTDIALKARFRITGMDCAACGTKIDNAVRRIEGVRNPAVSVSGETLALEYANDSDLDAVRDAVIRLGYGINRLEARADGSPMRVETPPAPWWKTPRALVTGACGAALVCAYAVGHVFPAAQTPAFIAALAIGLVPIAQRAFAAASSGSPFSIEMLMTVAAGGAVLIGAAEEAAAVVVLFLIGESLEGVAAGRARANIQSLAALVPKTALIVIGTEMKEVPADQLKIGDEINVRPGDRISADGVILTGKSSVNEAPVTGESVPKQRKTGDRVFAGTINGDGALRVRVTATAADNTIARVIALVEQAQESKAPTERFIDRFSKYYTPAVVVVAALVAVVPPLLAGGAWHEWIYKGLALLLIGCPCALVISTPAAIAASLSAGARRGLLMKGGAVLEQLGSLTTIAFDKTGTLTEGRPRVTDVVSAGRPEGTVLSLAGALESGSSHPLAIAILDKARAERVPLPPATESRAVAGKGIFGKVGGETIFLGSAKAAAEYSPLPPDLTQRIAALNGEGKTVSVLIAGDAPAGIIAMRDEARADAHAGLAALKNAGIKAIMLTGDNETTAQAVGSQLGIEVRGGLLPEQKLDIVKKLQANGEIMGKVGDGINDAPALATADVGIAMGGGTDVALETADAAVLHGRVADVAGMVDLSRRTMRVIHQNIAIALGLKAVFLVTTVAGITGLWPAILADTGATVLVTANSLRLLGQR